MPPNILTPDEARTLRLNEHHVVKTCAECPEFTNTSHCKSGFAPESTSFVCFGK